MPVLAPDPKENDRHPNIGDNDIDQHHLTVFIGIVLKNFEHGRLVRLRLRSSFPRWWKGPAKLASKSLPPTVSGEKTDTIRIAMGPPIMMPTVPVKNIIKALKPRLAIAFRSMLRVIKTSARRAIDTDWP